MVDSGIAEAMKHALMKGLAKQVRIGMDRINIDVAELAERSTVSADTIYNVLRGERECKIGIIALLAIGLEIPPAVLLMPVQ